jgi:ribonuclease Z
MELYFLGTGAGMPSRLRNVTSIALTMYDERGSMWLFDCGEGTQHQILSSPLKLSKLEYIFITHLHGDHIFGLPGLLSSRSHQGGVSPLTLFGPPGIESYVQTSLQLSESRINYELKFSEVNDGILFEDSHCKVTAAKLEHRIDSYGYRIEEHAKQGELLVDKLKQMGVPPGPMYGQLKKGIDILLPDGTTVTASEVIGPPIPGRTIVIIGDTKRCETSMKLAEHATVLVHEATFSGELMDLAAQFYHSTTVDAAITAQQAGVQTLICTHISARYSDDGDIENLLEQARSIFPESFIAYDHWRYTF